ncbi:putative ABC transport system permease protein [Sphingomonas sp. BK036]|uniref:FtsX-like permease family protein n=1 Tax=Sphingomonas sp. BK036 TaxID=2512122 RepID=UPI0010289FE2|nr:FtsX-like permease family protein [Sphingomonas sp. BK036]RZT53114.1 putative ABC transport system permease protein [Sphingomonas sp. BK036]
MSLVSARLALGWLIGGEWRVHPARLALTAVAIAIGVALGFAVHLVNGSALSSFEGALRSVNGRADVQVNATTPFGFDEALYARVATATGVADASPVVVLRASAGSARFTLLGLDVIRAAQVTPSLIGIAPAGVDRRTDAAFDGQALFLSSAALRVLRVRPGDALTVTANGKATRLRVAGALPGVAEGQAIGVVDIATAQWRFDRLGRLDRIDVKQADGASTAALTAILPRDATIGTSASDATRSDALSRAYRVNLDMLALVALLTGGFLVFSAQSLSVARRLRAFALIRTLGLPRNGIIATVALEGLAIGLIGSSLGLLLGYAVAYAALTRFGGDLGAGYFADGSVRLAFAPAAAVGFFLLGVFAAVAGSVLPARIAARVAPAAALRNAGDMIDPRTPVPWTPAAALIAVGGAAALLPAIGGLPLFGFASMALILAGGIAGMPWLARTVLAPLARRSGRSVASDLAIHHLHGAPGQAATALCGIVASTALMIAMAVMVTSFRGAVDEWLGQILSDDLYLRVEGSTGFDPAAQAVLRATPGVGGIAFSRQVPLTLAADRPPVTLIARPVDARFVLLDKANRLPAGTIPIWLSEPAARLYDWKVGASVTLPLAGRYAVAGIWRDYARQQGAIVMRETDYGKATGDRTRTEAAITLLPGADPVRVERALTARTPRALARFVSIARPATLRRYALELFDRSFAVTYLLEGVAVLVGLAGVAATMSAQTIARTREFGMLRHIGVSKRQIVAMLASEGALLGLVGGIAGIALGGIMAQVLVHVINPQSFNWTMATRVPWGIVASVAGALVIAAAGTATLAGRRAIAADAVRMVREDW